MDITINYHQVDRSESLDNVIKEKSERMLHSLNAKGKITWTCKQENRDSVADIHFHCKGKDYHVEAKADDFYKTVDAALNKLDHQLRKGLNKN